jgi:hypothetical protein
MPSAPLSQPKQKSSSISAQVHIGGGAKKNTPVQKTIPHLIGAINAQFAAPVQGQQQFKNKPTKQSGSDQLSTNTQQIPSLAQEGTLQGLFCHANALIRDCSGFRTLHLLAGKIKKMEDEAYSLMEASSTNSAAAPQTPSGIISFTQALVDDVAKSASTNHDFRERAILFLSELAINGLHGSLDLGRGEAELQTPTTPSALYPGVAIGLLHGISKFISACSHEDEGATNDTVAVETMVDNFGIIILFMETLSKVGSLSDNVEQFWCQEVFCSPVFDGGNGIPPTTPLIMRVAMSNFYMGFRQRQSAKSVALSPCQMEY